MPAMPTFPGSWRISSVKRSSAKPVANFRRLAYSAKVQAALEGYNHDISQQQITILQTPSQPRFPWYVNSEIEDQTQTPLVGGQPALTYQRFDARLEIDEAEYRRPEHIESLLGRQMPAREVERLRQLDIKDTALLDVLFQAGEALGRAQLLGRGAQAGPAIAADWPPANFNPAGWR